MPLLSQGLLEGVLLFVITTGFLALVKLFFDVRDIKMMLIGYDGTNGMRSDIRETKLKTVKLQDGQQDIIERLIVLEEHDRKHG